MALETWGLPVQHTRARSRLKLDAVADVRTALSATSSSCNSRLSRWSPRCCYKPGMTDKTRILVCIKCRAPGESKELPFDRRMGGRLYREVAAAAEGAADVEIVPVECFSVCNRPVTIGVTGQGKWTTLYGDYPMQSAAEILAAARRHVGADGLIPKEDRPLELKKRTISRTPPF